MATPFELIYSKFLGDIDDYELGLLNEDELNNICFGYLEKARALYFPQCTKDLENVTIMRQSEIDAGMPFPPVDVEIPVVEVQEPVVADTNLETPVEPTEGIVAEESIDEEVITLSEEVSGQEVSDAPTEDVGDEQGDTSDATEEPMMDEEQKDEQLDSEVEEDVAEDATDVEGDNTDVEEVEEFKVDRIVGQFNEDLTNKEQYILALGMKKAWLSSKKYSADLMSKDIGDRDYKAVQGFNYLKELHVLDGDLEEEIRDYGIAYTYSVQALGVGW